MKSIWNASGKCDSLYVLYSNDLDRDKRIALLKNKLLLSCYYISFHSSAHEISFLSLFLLWRSFAGRPFGVPCHCAEPSHRQIGVFFFFCMWSAVVPFDRRATSYPRRGAHSVLVLLLIPVYHYRYLSHSTRHRHHHCERNRTISLLVHLRTRSVTLIPSKYQNARGWRKCKYDCVNSWTQRSVTVRCGLSSSLSLYYLCKHTHTHTYKPCRTSLAQANHLGIALQVLCQLIHTNRHDSFAARSTENAWGEWERINKIIHARHTHTHRE